MPASLSTFEIDQEPPACSSWSKLRDNVHAEWCAGHLGASGRWTSVLQALRENDFQLRVEQAKLEASRRELAELDELLVTASCLDGTREYVFSPVEIEIEGEVAQSTEAI